MIPKQARQSKAGWAAALVLALTASVTQALGCMGREDRALRELPERDRGALYARTMETLRGVCAGREAEGLDEFCRRQAEFVTHFPECNGTCQNLVRTFSPKATR